MFYHTISGFTEVFPYTWISFLSYVTSFVPSSDKIILGSKIKLMRLLVILF